MNIDESQNSIDKLLLEALNWSLEKKGNKDDLYIDGKIKGVLFAVEIIKESINK